MTKNIETEDSDTNKNETPTTEVEEVEVRTNKDEDTILREPNQPDYRSIPPQKHTVKKEKEIRFQLSWYEKFKWIHYDETVEGVLCFICVSASQQGLTSITKSYDDAFMKNGFRNWKKAVESFHEHECSQSHRFAVTQKAHLATQGPINTQLNEEARKQHDISKECLKLIFTSTRFLARQGIAFRGHGAGSGNLDQLLQLRCEDNPKLKRCVHKLSKSQKVDLSKSQLKLWTCKRLKFN